VEEHDAGNSHGEGGAALAGATVENESLLVVLPMIVVLEVRQQQLLDGIVLLQHTNTNGNWQSLFFYRYTFLGCLQCHVIGVKSIVVYTVYCI
jgi:hypothetical protein